MYLIFNRNRFYTVLSVFCISLAGLLQADKIVLSSPNGISSQNQQKPECLIYGNCQALFIYHYLNENFPENFHYTFVLNFLVIEGKEAFPYEAAKRADLFIYQPIHGHEECDTDLIISNHLKKDCALISFPYLYFLGYFPDFTPDPNNQKTIAPNMPYGVFPYGSQKLIELVERGLTTDQIIEMSYSDDFIPQELIFEKLTSSLQKLREKERETDIKLADFIERKFRRHKLFLSTNHPTNKLLKELMKQVLTKMKLPKKGIDKNKIFKREFNDKWTNGIIYPCVAKILGLQFNLSPLCFMGDKVPYPIYIEEYVHCLYRPEQSLRSGLRRP